MSWESLETRPQALADSFTTEPDPHPGTSHLAAIVTNPLTLALLW